MVIRSIGLSTLKQQLIKVVLVKPVSFSLNPYRLQRREVVRLE